MNFRERYLRYPDHYHFHDRIREILKYYTHGIPMLRVLDYGSGAIRHSLGFFRLLQRDQAPVVAYDPSLDDRAVALNEPGETTWTNEAPVGKSFDLVVCHYSLHHMAGHPQSIIGNIRVYKPRLIAIMEYDYRQSTVEEFAQTFTTENEVRELTEVFHGDVEACFEYHRQIGRDVYHSGLGSNGFRILHDESGIGVAQHKFILIGAV